MKIKKLREDLEKYLRIYSFRIDKKYRAIFIYTNNEVEIITITNHYK